MLSCLLQQKKVMALFATSLYCNHYVMGEEKADISCSLQFSLGDSAVKSARAMGKKRSRQEGV